MKCLNLKCPGCNANLEVDIDNLQAYCQYCGRDIHLDVSNRVLAERERTKREQEKTKREQEATKRFQIEQEYRDKRDRRKRSATGRILIGCVLLYILLMGFCFYMAHLEENEHHINNEIQISASSQDLKKETIENASRILQNIGFQNISVKNKEDLVLGWLSKEGDIESITINGKSTFSEGDWFSTDAIVIITYHGFADGDLEHEANNDIKMSMSSKDLLDETVDDAVKILQNLGFKNIETKNKEDLTLGWFSKEGDIESIAINGVSKFSEGDWFSVDAIVIVTYHGFAEDKD